MLVDHVIAAYTHTHTHLVDSSMRNTCMVPVSLLTHKSVESSEKEGGRGGREKEFWFPK